MTKAPMNVESVLSRLQRVRRLGAGWMALCPAHEDQSASLSVKEDNGRVLLHCFAGCSIEAVCESLKIRVRDLFSEPRTWRKPEPHIVSEARRQIADLRSRLTPRGREQAVTVIKTNEANLDHAIARALALAVEGELVQIAFDREAP